jgi:hypothetical protein
MTAPQMLWKKNYFCSLRLLKPLQGIDFKSREAK